MVLLTSFFSLAKCWEVNKKDAVKIECDLDEEDGK